MNEPLNVVRRVRAEQVITDRLSGIKQAAHYMRACEWANSRERTDVTVQQLYETKKIAQELDQENKELLVLRRARLRDFLKAEAEVFEQQLNDKGLAFSRDP